MRPSMYVAHNKCICRPTMGCAAILWKMAIQAIFWHSGAGIDAFLASQFNRALDNAAEIPRPCTWRQSHVLRVARALCGTNALSISVSSSTLFHRDSFFQICINGWMCSIIYHTRDFPLTELLDYGFAYSMVLANFCCMLLR